MLNKTKVLCTAIILFAGAWGIMLHANEINIDYFYDALAPYGEWINLQPYGWVWSPDNVDPDWKPYTTGYWAYTDYGWTFVSDDEYGWAVYHYGRWTYDDDNGWIWIPGTTWGPAWVAWRYDNDHIGWAPLPWRVGWSVSVGIGSFNIDNAIPWSHWCFIESRHFSERRVLTFVLNPAFNVTIIRQTRNFTNYRYVDKRIVNDSIRISDIERFTRQKVVRYNLADAKSRDQSDRLDAKSARIDIFKPSVSSSKVSHVPSNKYSNTKESKDQIVKQQNLEQQKLNEAYNKKQEDLKRKHSEDLQNAKDAKVQADLKARQERENQALQEQKQKDAKVLINKQKRKRDEQDDNNKKDKNR
jgi:hypothetical protein